MTLDEITGGSPYGATTIAGGDGSRQPSANELAGAMDQPEGSSRTPPAQREQQFLRLRDRIEARAARKFSDVELEGNPPGVILRAIDFREARK